MDIRKVVILVVHGTGDQQRFGSLEEVALNVAKALRKDPARKAQVEVIEGDQAQRNATDTCWRDSPVRVSWLSGPAQRIEATFREVFWADLDYQVSFFRWLRLVFWALTMPGVRIFSLGDGPPGSQEGDPAAHRLLSVPQLSLRARIWIRLRLGFVCCPLFFVLLLVNILQALLRRLSIDLRLDRILYDYMGDILLYQDWLTRDTNIEGFEEKSRVAIRRRMVRALVRTAAECSGPAAQFAGYYVFAHSLGGIVALNALMEPTHVLPGYLNQEEWDALPSAWKQKVPSGAPAIQTPQRPLWLSNDDAIDRSQLLERLDGLLTVGCPLDKFAALWPAIVPISRDKVSEPVRWLNVFDLQDIIADRIDLFFDRPVEEGGARFDLAALNFKLTDREWAGSRTPFLAHNSYWTTHPKRARLVDQMIPWLERKAFPTPPPDLYPKAVARALLVMWTTLSILLLFLIDAVIFHNVPTALSWLGIGTSASGSTYFGLSLPTGRELPRLYALVVALSVSGVVVFSLVRRGYERLKYGPQYVKNFGA